MATNGLARSRVSATFVRIVRSSTLRECPTVHMHSMTLKEFPVPLIGAWYVLVVGHHWMTYCSSKHDKAWEDFDSKNCCFGLWRALVRLFSSCQLCRVQTENYAKILKPEPCVQGRWVRILRTFYSKSLLRLPCFRVFLQEHLVRHRPLLLGRFLARLFLGIFLRNLDIGS